MKINFINILGFGKLINREYSFKDGLNLVYGPNEAGKSTLQKALSTMMFGFFDEGRISKSLRMVRDLFQPWDRNASYAGELGYELNNLRKYRIIRSFEDDYETKLYTLPEYQDITGQFTDYGKGRLDFPEKQFGISKTVFENTCIIRQTELLSYDSPSVDEISETLMKLSTSGSSSVDVSAAIDILETILREDIGSDRAYTKPYAKECDKLSDLMNEWQSLVAIKRDFLSKVVEQGQLEDNLKILELEIGKVRYLQLLADIESVHEKKAKLENSENEIDEYERLLSELPDMTSFPYNIRDELLSLYSTLKHQANEFAQLEERSEKSNIEIILYQRKIENIEDKIKSINSASNLSDSEFKSLLQLKQNYDLKQSELEGAQHRYEEAHKNKILSEKKLETFEKDLGDISISNLSELRQSWNSVENEVIQKNAIHSIAKASWDHVGMSNEKFLDLEKIANDIQSGLREPEQKKGCSKLLSPIFSQSSESQVSDETTLYNQLKPIWESFSSTKSELILAEKRRDELESDLKTRFSNFVECPITKEFFTNIEKVLEDSLRAEAANSQKEEEINQAQVSFEVAKKNLNHAHNNIIDKLKSFGFDGADIQGDIESCREIIQTQSEIHSLESMVENLNHQIEQERAQIQQFREVEVKYFETQSNIASLLEKASIICDENISKGLDLYESKYQEYQKWLRSKSLLQNSLERYENLKKELNPKELDIHLIQLEDIKNKIQEENKEWHIIKPNKTHRQYEDILRELEQRKAQTKQDLATLHVDINRIGGRIKHPAELAEQIQIAKYNIEKFEFNRSALELAISEIQTATQMFNQQFAPRVEQLMEIGLQKITSSRYSKVNIDPKTLKVRVRSPELGKNIEVHQLSTGTQDLIYILLRMSISHQMSNTGENLPLLFDDPFVHFDQERLLAVLSYIKDLSEYSQIFLFSMQPEIQNFFIDHDLYDNITYI